jgi:hypothetical protein
MSEIQQASTTPSYIDTFIKKNMEQLVQIHDEGIDEHKSGCLGFKCSEKENKMDVFFMDEDLILRMIQKDSWEDLKNNIGNRKLFFINDLDMNAIFLVYI